MSTGYTKLFASLLASSVWLEAPHIKVVWVTMLAMADQDGEVMAAVPGLAHLSGVSLAQCEEALALFLAPDTHSRTKLHEGRRIEEIDGGWRLLNHGKYRAMKSDAERRQKDAERKRAERAAARQVQ